MEDTYPSPCIACQKENCLHGCEAWRIRYLYRQNQINAYARKVLKPVPRKLDPNLRPCDGCSVDENCDKPCQAYLRYYNHRMAQIRKRCGL